MKLHLTAAILAVCALPASAATTFDVHRATGSLSGFVKDTSGGVPVLIGYKLTTNQIINLARGRALKDPVPKNEVLAGAGDFDKIFLGDPSAERRVIVWDTNPPGALLASIILADTATVQVAENHFTAKGGFKRVGFGDGIVQPVGNAANGFVSGLLRFNALFKRTIARTGPRPATPTYSETVFGRIILTDASVGKEFFVTKGSLLISGKRLGQFTE